MDILNSTNKRASLIDGDSGTVFCAVQRTSARAETSLPLWRHIRAVEISNCIFIALFLVPQFLGCFSLILDEKHTLICVYMFVYVINELLHGFSFICTHIFHCIRPQVNDSTKVSSFTWGLMQWKIWVQINEKPCSNTYIFCIKNSFNKTDDKYVSDIDMFKIHHW